MAKYYDNEISFDTNWGGDDTTGNLPVSGNRVQEAIKKEVNSKVGYVGLYAEGGYYVLCKNEDVYNEWLKTVDEEHIFGDESLIVGHFDAPYNYSMKIVILDPESGYKSSLVGSAGNTIRFYANTIDKDDAVIRESITVTIKVTNENGVSTQQKMIYDFDSISNTDGVVYDLTGKLSSGKNIITISAVGMNTNASTMRSITYNYADIYLKDTFDITKSYSYDSDGDLTINVGYSLKGIGKTTVFWYFDGELIRFKQMSNENPNLSAQNEAFYFNKVVNAWATAGKHTLQMYMECEDMNSKEIFHTPIYYREFIIEDPLNLLNSPYVMIKCEYEYKDNTSIVANGGVPLIYGGKEFENVSIKYVAFYRGKGSCEIDTYITYNGDEPKSVSSENVSLSNNFSSLLDKYIALDDKGRAKVTFKAYYSNSSESVDTNISLDIDENDMKIQTVNDSVELYLNASGRTNQIGDEDGYLKNKTWVYEYVENNKVKTIETTFSKNEYVRVSERNDVGEVMKPSDANANNSLKVDALPSTKNEAYEYLIYNGDYYVWTREFDWSNTSGWYENKLRIGKDNMITINFQPFSADMIRKIKENGATFEFEFETTNVYDDDAVICRICGTNNFAPGISIYASGAELVISREVVEGEYDDEGNQINTNAGYIKAVSTKYKSEESNRISFVITPDIEGNREKLLLIYVNGECCGAYPYTNVNEFFNASKISFRGTDKACVNISNLKLYSKRLSSNEILDNFIYYRLDTKERTAIYKRNDIVRDDNNEVFESTKLLSQLPVMTFYQLYEDEGIDIIHQEKKNKKLPVHFDVVYIDVQDPTKNFVIKKALITPQGTSSMNYPVKNFRLYTDKDDDDPATLYVGSNIFINGDTTDLSVENLNPNCIVSKKKYAMRDNSIPVKCWCLKADFAESSSSHNTGTARYWNEVLKSGGFTTKAQDKAVRYKDEYKNEDGESYDVRTTVDGFPIVLFYQDMKGSALRFEGKYNFNNDKSTEDVFGFTGGVELSNQVVKYYYIGKEEPTIHYEEDEETHDKKWACSWSNGGYTDTPTVDSPLYTSKYLEDGSEEWYMLRGKELFDNPKMECWEILNSVSDLALFKTVQGFTLNEDEEKVGLESKSGFEEAFESRYPDCGDYFHTNSLKRFAEWLVSCCYLTIDSTTGKAVPFELNKLPSENYYRNDEGLISIQSLSKQEKTFKIDYPDYNFYKEVEYDTISTAIRAAGYVQYTLPSGLTEDQIGFIELEEKPENEIYTDEDGKVYYFIKVNGKLYTWKESNLGEFAVLPDEEETLYDFIKVGEKYFIWANEFNFSDYYEAQWVDDTPFNRALKFAVEKYDHIEMDKMAAYYIYLMRFGGVDQTVKNSMLTSEGPATDDPNSTLPSLWYFINYDNDTILGVKNDGRLVFDPYITRDTKDGTGYVYAGRESTLWNNLEADIEFMNKVTEVDNALAEGKGNTRYALSYNNAVREYETNQSDKWCERIYNKDAERKYIDTYVKGWTQHDSETNETLTNVYEDYLYDVQGSRSAHRKWWLGRRFNIFDSKFCNSNFRSSFIKFRSSNLPAGSSFTIRSGEPIYYAWGHDNSVTDITPEAIQPNDEWTFTTRSTFNIGSYLEVMGAANMLSFDLRNCVGDLTEINIENCYSPTIGTKLRELHIGDHTRTDLQNVSTTQMNFGGLGSAARLEYLDITNIQNIFALDGLEKLLNIRELYTKGTNVDNYQFANGAQIEYVEFSKTVKTISFIGNSKITYKGLNFEGENYGQLLNLTIDHCPNLLTDPTMILDWLSKRSEAQKANINLNLQGIKWTLYGKDYAKLFALENVGTSNIGSALYGGRIKIESDLGENAVKLFKKIFNDNCFTDGAALYIEAPKNVYIDAPDVLWEGTTNNKIEITLVGATLNDKIEVYATVLENDTEIYVDNVDEITLDPTMLNDGYITVNIDESARNFSYLYINVTLTLDNGNTTYYTSAVPLRKRVYPDRITIVTEADSFNNTNPNTMTLDFVPDELDDLKFEGRGDFTVDWDMVEGTTDYKTELLLNKDGEKATIQARQGFDGTVTIGCEIIRNWDKTIVAYGEKKLEFTNPNTIITESRNKPVYDVLVKHGIIVPREDGYGFLTKTDASKLGMSAFVDENGNSIFKGNKDITSFLEFEYFNGNEMGQMPMEGVNKVLTPVGMFEGCTNLKEIAFSQSFKYANDKMFSGCTNLEHIYGYSRATGDGRAKQLTFEYVGSGFAANCKKLKTCLIGEDLATLKADAFLNCETLDRFDISSNQNLEIEISTSSTPFVGCKNITFDGHVYPSTLNSPYQIIDGSVYKIEDDKFTLIHMGKDSLMEKIPLDKPVYACAYSMEYRTEENVVVPENVVFDGQRIFRGSTGQTLTLKCLVSNNCDYLFDKTDYGTNYVFADGETKIPSYCFDGVSVKDFKEYTIPEGIKTIGNNAFYNVNLEKIIFPSTLETIGGSSFWLTSLKTIVCNGTTPPSISDEDFFNVMLDEVVVQPDVYTTFKENIMPLISPFVRPSHLYSEGKIRIIKDGEFILDKETYSLTVGGINAELTTDEYFRYVSPEVKTDTTIILTNNETGVKENLGVVYEQTMTLYTGDNSMLFSGEGYDFTKGIYVDTALSTKLAENGWFYDRRFEGLRSNPSVTPSTMTFDVSDLVGENTNIIMGKYSQYDTAGALVKNGDGDILIEISNGTTIKNGYNISNTIMIDNSDLIFEHTDRSIKTGINGIVINKIGTKTYSDPEPQNIVLGNGAMGIFKAIYVNLVSDVQIPNGVMVEVYDNEQRTYKKQYNGEPLTFIIPSNAEYTIKASAYISEKGKVFKEVYETITPDMSGSIDVVYNVEESVEYIGNTIIFKSTDTDYYIDLNYKTSLWSTLKENIDGVNTVDVISSTANGFENTNLILASEPDNAMFNEAFNRWEDETIQGYIPSYEELLFVGEKLGVKFDTAWTSETYDADFAWGSDGEKHDKSEVMKYYVFGRKINL